jgi:hypothetical protein
VDVIREELEDAEFSEISFTTMEKTSVAPSPRHPAIAYCEGTPLRNEIEIRDGSRLPRITDKTADAIAERFGDGPVTGKIQSHIVTAQ